jgi:cardiolipin synthase A/B
MTIWSALGWAIIVASLFIVPRNRKPGAATAWLMLIILQPYIGLALFLMIGSPKLSGYRRLLQRRANEIIAVRVREAQDDPEVEDFFEPSLPPNFEPLIQLNAALGGMPACVGNKVDLIPGYNDAIAALTDAVKTARLYVHVEFYILALDATTEPFFQALEDARRRAVPVRMLIDHVASRGFPRRKEMTERLTSAGVDWHWSLPVRPFSNHRNRPDLRNHRKLVVIDGMVAFTGSMNMIDATYGRRRNLERGQHYIEMVARVEGPVVLELNAVFMTDWFSENGTPFDTTTPSARELRTNWSGSSLCQVLPSGPGYDNDNNLRLFTTLIHAARERVVITTPYFVPDDSLMIALTSAAQRGVAVTLISAGVSNQFVVYYAQRSYYEELLHAGVRIFLVRKPLLLHAKHVSVDDEVAVIGSSNLDMRSFTLNLEVTLLVYDREVVQALHRAEIEFRARANQLSTDSWRRRPLPARLLENLARLTASLQ